MMLTRSQPWAERALCAQTDPEAFFPERGGSTKEAKAVCRRCPVTQPCLEAALASGERFGVYGGLSERERRALLEGANRRCAICDEEFLRAGGAKTCGPGCSAVLRSRRAKQTHVDRTGAA